MPGSPVPSDRKLVQALRAAEEPGMRKLIVGLITKDAWSPEAGDAEPDAEPDAADGAGVRSPADDEGAGGEPDELSPASIKAVLRWTFDIDLTEQR